MSEILSWTIATVSFWLKFTINQQLIFANLSY